METIKSYIIIALIFIISCCATYIIYHNYHSKSIDTNINPNTLQPIEKKVDKKGNSFEQIKEITYTKEQVDKITDSLKKVYDFNRVDGVVKFISVVDTISELIPVYIDTSTHTIFALDSNRYLRNSFLGNSKTGLGQFSLKLTEDTTQLIFGEKWHLFKPNEQIITLTHSNPYFKTDSAQAFTKKIPKPILDFDVFLGYDPFLKKPTVAIGVGFHIFSLKLK